MALSDVFRAQISHCIDVFQTFYHYSCFSAIQIKIVQQCIVYSRHRKLKRHLPNLYFKMIDVGYHTGVVIIIILRASWAPVISCRVSVSEQKPVFCFKIKYFANLDLLLGSFSRKKSTLNNKLRPLPTSLLLVWNMKFI